MGKAGFIMQGARGKLGDVVFKKGERKTIQVPLTTPANPKTYAQAKQRCAFAMANSAAAGLRWLVNHSFQNITGEKQNIREFIRINSKLLRAELDANGATGAAFLGNAQIKGARGMQAANYIVSRGSVYYPVFATPVDAPTEPGVSIDAQVGGSLNDNITDQTSYESVLAALGLNPGDQLSVIAILDYPTIIAEYQGEKNWQCQSFGARVTFLPTLPENFSGKLIDANGHINAALTDATETIGTIILAEGTGNKINILIGNVPTGGVVQAVGVIRSQKDMNGKYCYSPCQLLFTDEGNHAPTVVESYMTQSADTNSDYFLDQPLKN